MSGGWTGKEVLLKKETQTVSAVGVVSNEFALTHGGATKALRIDFSLENNSSIAGCTAQLQMRINGVWTDTTLTVALTANGVASILMHEEEDSAILPLTDWARIKVTAYDSGSIDISSIKVYQEL